MGALYFFVRLPEPSSRTNSGLTGIGDFRFQGKGSRILQYFIGWLAFYFVHMIHRHPVERRDCCVKEWAALGWGYCSAAGEGMAALSFEGANALRKLFLRVLL